MLKVDKNKRIFTVRTENKTIFNSVWEYQFVQIEDREIWFMRRDWAEAYCAYRNAGMAHDRALMKVQMIERTKYHGKEKRAARPIRPGDYRPFQGINRNGENEK